MEKSRLLTTIEDEDVSDTSTDTPYDPTATYVPIFFDQGSTRTEQALNNETSPIARTDSSTSPEATHSTIMNDQQAPQNEHTPAEEYRHALRAFNERLLCDDASDDADSLLSRSSETFTSYSDDLGDRDLEMQYRDMMSSHKALLKQALDSQQPECQIMILVRLLFNTCNYQRTVLARSHIPEDRRPPWLAQYNALLLDLMNHLCQTYDLEPIHHDTRLESLTGTSPYVSNVGNSAG